MKERPIIFSTDNVRAILDGRKTQTRRIVKLPKWMLPYEPDLDKAYADGGVFAAGAYLKVPLTKGDMAQTVQRVFCPYGYPHPKGYLVQRGKTKIGAGFVLDIQERTEDEPSDRLWVKETYILEAPNEMPEDEKECTPRYKADGLDISDWFNVGSGDIGGKWQPSLFMPRWASRILLEITEIRVERLQEISEADAEAEGLNPAEYDNPNAYADLPCTNQFGKFWDSLNAKRGYGWKTNPWVWVISFKVVY